MTTITGTRNQPTELSTDRRFERRVRRLIAVSSIMLGLITLLAALSPEAEPLAIGLLVAGWVLMPTLLDLSVERPRMRYLLAVPATLVAAGLVGVASSMSGWSMTNIGWWVLTAGVLIGGGLGMWFWFRWMPVPNALDNPFSSRRIALIVVHVTLILVGMGLIIFG